MNLRVVQFLAIMPTALALIPAGAHLFELLNKIDLTRDAYLTVQGGGQRRTHPAGPAGKRAMRGNGIEPGAPIVEDELGF
jgi:hypothetical protein